MQQAIFIVSRSQTTFFLLYWAAPIIKEKSGLATRDYHIQLQNVIIFLHKM